MARNIKIITNKTIKQLNAIGDSVSKQIAVTLREVADKGKEAAQSRLKKTTANYLITQEITPAEAAEYIGVAIEGKVPRGGKNKHYTARIYAPTNKKYANAMYYLEYGAGLGTKNHTPVINKYGADVWGFPVKEGTAPSRLRKLTSTGFVMQLYRGEAKLNSPAIYKTKINGEERLMGITNISQRIGYMKHARRYILENARAKTLKDINLALRRPYYKSIMPSGGEE